MGRRNNLIFLPLAFKKKDFQKKKLKDIKDRKYDLFFSGILRNWNFPESQSDLRIRIQNELFFNLFDIPIMKKFKYKDLKIFWKPFYKSRIKNKVSKLLHGPRLNEKDYFQKLENSKCVLHTSSPMGIISTRIFEVLSTGALGVFSENSNAKVLFTNKKHYVEFDEIQKFIFLIYQVKDIKNEKHFQEISDKGRKEVHSNHNWGSRIDCFIKKINS